MSYWCPKPKGTTKDIYCKKSILTQLISVKYHDDDFWETIQKRLITPEHRHEAFEQDKFGVTALHHVIRKQQKRQQQLQEQQRLLQQHQQQSANINVNINVNVNVNVNDNDDNLGKKSSLIIIEIIRLLIDENPSSLDDCDTMTGCNALHLACNISQCVTSTNNRNHSNTKTNTNTNNTYDETMKEIIKIILDKRPDITMKLCKDGRLPLHRCKDVEIIQRLIDIYPKGLGVITKSHGYLPLHDACSDSKVSIEVVKLLTQHGIQNKIGKRLGNNISSSSSSSSSKHNFCGGLLVKDLYGDMPIKIIFRRILFLNKNDNDDFNNQDNDTNSSNGNSSSNSNNNLWKKLCFIVKATYMAMHGRGLSYNENARGCYNDNYNYNDIPLVHAIIECGGHMRLVKYAIKLYPKQILYRDEYHGRTPLSVACSKVNTSPDIFQLLIGTGVDNCDEKKTHNNNDCDGYDSYNDSSQQLQSASAFTSTSIKNETNAAQIVDKDGRLPLHIALESGRTWKNGIEVIANAAPIAIQTRDKRTGMHPFMLASIPNYRWDNTCIDTIYTLARAVPHVIYTTTKKNTTL